MTPVTNRLILLHQELDINRLRALTHQLPQQPRKQRKRDCPKRLKPTMMNFNVGMPSHSRRRLRLVSLIPIASVLLILQSVHPSDAFNVGLTTTIRWNGSQRTESQRIVRTTTDNPSLALHSFFNDKNGAGADTDNDTTSLPAVSSDDLVSDRSLGLLVLLSVPLAWGTYTPVVKYLYEIKPAVPGFVFSAAYYGVASLVLNLLRLAQEEQEPPNVAQLEETADGGQTSSSVSTLVLGGVELGSYLFLGNALQIIGLRTVPSDRAGFLVQLTTVMVPLVEALVVRGNLFAVSVKTWIACLLAFGGVTVMGLDGNTATNDAMQSLSIPSLLSSFSQGDLFILGAALVYTMHVVRLGKYARETTPLDLAASKATVEFILSASLVGILTMMSMSGGNMVVDGIDSGNSGDLLRYAQGVGQEIVTFFSLWNDGIASVPPSTLLPAIGAVLWTGLVTCAYTIYAQSFGQKRVRPTEANLIYTVQPLFTALFAYVLLGETLGPAGTAGGALIAGAVYTVASQDQMDIGGDDDDDDTNGGNDTDVNEDRNGSVGSTYSSNKRVDSKTTLVSLPNIVRDAVRRK